MSKRYFDIEKFIKDIEEDGEYIVEGFELYNKKIGGCCSIRLYEPRCTAIRDKINPYCNKIEEYFVEVED